MAWADPDLDVLSGWQLPVGLAGASLLPELPWRLLQGVGGWLADMLGVAAVGFVVTQSLVGSPEVGLALAWFLVGVLTYQYTHLLYPDAFDDVVDTPGFRALTAVGTLYFGLVAWGSIVPSTVPAQKMLGITSQSGFNRVILSVIVGMVVGTAVFWVYFTRWHSHALVAEESDLTAAMHQFFESDVAPTDKTGRDNLEALPARWESFVRSIQAVVYSFTPVLICGVVGMVGLVLNLFYPLPEAVLFVGLVAIRVLPDDALPAGRISNEIDLRLLDSVSGATRNLKGAIMILYGVIGMALSAMVFVFFTGGMVAVISSSGEGGAAEGLVLVLGVVSFVGVVVSLLIMGVYSLVHWVRQLERIGPYAQYWEADVDEAEVQPTVTRPPWLLVPAHLPPVALLVNYVLYQGTTRQAAFGAVAVLSFIAVVTMSWGLVWAWRHEPQPLTHESRDLLVTVLLQIGVVTAIFGIVNLGNETIQLETGVILPLILVVGFIQITVYLPDIEDWSSRQEGIWEHLPVVCLIIVVLVFIWLLRVRSGASAAAVGVLLVLLLLYVLAHVVGRYLEWRFEVE